MSEENNKIEINKLLEVANVKNLSKYFKNPDAKISIKDLLDEFLDSILGISKQPDSKPDSKVVSEVFASVGHIWENYKEKGCNTHKKFDYINRQSKSDLCYDKK